MIVYSFESHAVARRVLATLLLAIATLLVCALPAGAEVTGGEIADRVSPAVTSAPEDPTPAEQPLPAPSTPKPVEVEVEAPSPGDSTAAAVDSRPTVSSKPPAPAPSNPPNPSISTRPSIDAGSRPSVVADSAPPVNVTVPSPTKPDATIASPAKRRLSGLVEGVHRDPTQTIATASGQSSSAVQVPHSSWLTDGISSLVQPRTEGALLEAATLLDRLLASPRLKALELKLLTHAFDSVAPATVETLLTLTGAGFEMFGPKDAQGFSEPSLAGLFSHRPSLVSTGPWIKYSLDVGPMQTETPSSHAGREKGHLPATGRLSDALNGAHLGIPIHPSSSPNPRPSPLPPPAPESPGGVEAGSGVSFFAPFAALLALLALVAPATLRRRLKAADFPRPTQFVCALERPG